MDYSVITGVQSTERMDVYHKVNSFISSSIRQIYSTKYVKEDSIKVAMPYYYFMFLCYTLTNDFQKGYSFRGDQNFIFGKEIVIGYENAIVVYVNAEMNIETVSFKFDLSEFFKQNEVPVKDEYKKIINKTPIHE